MRQYKYTLLKQDGTAETLGRADEYDFEKIRKVLGCKYIELIPATYHQEAWGRCIVYGDEEGRFNDKNIRNPHTKVLKDADGQDWDCVGDLLLAQW